VHEPAAFAALVTSAKAALESDAA